MLWRGLIPPLCPAPAVRPPPPSASSSSSQVADAPLHHRVRPACLAVTSEHRAPATITGQARRSRMADKTEERQAIVIALTTEQTEHIWRGIGVVVTELTIHLGDEQAPQAPRMFPPGPSAQAYPPGPSRA